MATGTVSFVEKEKTIVVKEREPRIHLDLSVEEALYLQLVIGRMSEALNLPTPYYGIRRVLCDNDFSAQEFIKGEFLPPTMLNYINKCAKTIKEKLNGQS